MAEVICPHFGYFADQRAVEQKTRELCVKYRREWLRKHDCDLEALEREIDLNSTSIFYDEVVAALQESENWDAVSLCEEDWDDIDTRYGFIVVKPAEL